MVVTDSARDFLKELFKRNGMEAISLQQSAGCCGGGTLNIAYERIYNDSYYLINDTKVYCYNLSDEEIENIAIDSDGSKIIIKSIDELLNNN